MKTVLRSGVLLLTFIAAARANAPDSKPQILIEAKFVEITSGGAAPMRVMPEFRLPAPLVETMKVPGLVGILTDPQFQKIIRSLSQRKGVDLLSSPRLMTSAGQEGKIEVTQDFTYNDKAGKPVTKKCGVSLAVLAKTTGDNELDLRLSPQITTVEYVKRRSGQEEPVLKERKASVNVVMVPGTTSVLEMEPTTDKQLVQETDAADRIISSKTMLYHKRLLVFVTASWADPATGKPRTH
jgi:type II secretory pathway component GspD/PulD (secretin)